ncbi:MAG TPA: hypothetical protein VGS10_23835 [Terracidiphilus sp.]|nr:hypothetical protein [Terracidiphilus sp.]
MDQLATISNRIRKYPYWARRSDAVILLGVLLFIVCTSQRRMTVFDVVIVAALFLVAFLQHRGRPYWFLWGIVSGAVLVDFLGKWHLFLAR